MRDATVRLELTVLNFGDNRHVRGTYRYAPASDSEACEGFSDFAATQVVAEAARRLPSSGLSRPHAPLGTTHSLVAEQWACSIRDADGKAYCWNDPRNTKATAKTRAVAIDELEAPQALALARNELCALTRSGRIDCVDLTERTRRWQWDGPYESLVDAPGDGAYAVRIEGGRRSLVHLPSIRRNADSQVVMLERDFSGTHLAGAEFTACWSDRGVRCRRIDASAGATLIETALPADPSGLQAKFDLVCARYGERDRCIDPRAPMQVIDAGGMLLFASTSMLRVDGSGPPVLLRRASLAQWSEVLRDESRRTSQPFTAAIAPAAISEITGSPLSIATEGHTYQVRAYDDHTEVNEVYRASAGE